MERKVCFFSDAGNFRGLGQMSVQRPTPPTDNQWERAFMGWEKGATCRNNIVSTDSYLQIGHQCSDQRHLGHCAVHSCSAAKSYPTICHSTDGRQARLCFTISQSLLKLMSIESVMPSNQPILWRPLLLLPSVFPHIRIFSNESALCIRWPKYWNFSISPFDEQSGLI